MADGRFEQIYQRERDERRRARLYQLALAAVILFVLIALAVVARSILFTIG